MDQKSWPWKKKSSEKTILVASDKAKLTTKVDEEEIQTLLTEKAELKRNLKALNDKLSSTLADCNAKDELVKKHEKTAQEAMAGLEKAEKEAMSLKNELGKAIEQRASDEERVSHLDSALKECMQQLRFVREEQERRIHDAVMKTAEQFEKSQKVLEDKLAETSKRLAKITVENTHLSKVLLLKEKMIEDLNRQFAALEMDFSALMSRLETAQKDNASLTYEVRVLEKEVEIRNEEREFNLRTSDAAHKQHLVSVKKIAKLESECQRLRVLVSKRLPGPAALAKMKNEVEILGRDSFGKIRRRQSTNSSMDNSPMTPTKNNRILTEQLSVLEEENKALKEALQASKLLEESPIKDQKHMEPMKSCLVSHELSLGSVSDIGSDDKVSSAESSRASALITELDQFRNGKRKECKTVEASDLVLMDDFVEMEKLAIDPIDKPAKAVSGSLETESIGCHSELVIGKERSSHVDDSLSESVKKLIELIEGINLPSWDCAYSETSKKDGNLYSEISSGYMVRVFHWKVSELNAALKKFVHTCYDLLNGEANIKAFVQELNSALDWIMNHCFSLQDVSSMKDSIKKQFDWDESRSESEVENGMVGHFSELDKLWGHKAQTEECTKLRDDLMKLESAKKEWEEKFQLATDKSESLTNQLSESEKTVISLKKELEILNESAGILEDQIKDQHLINGDLDTQLEEARVELDGEKLSSLEVEVEDKNSCCEELEANCLDLQPQPESVTKQKSPKNDLTQEERQLRTDWEITAASEKLAECQETILNLGKQLKALAAPKEAILFDKLVSAPTDEKADTTIPVPSKEKKITNRRPSLLDQIQAEDLKQLEPEEVDDTSIEPNEKAPSFVEASKIRDVSAAKGGSLAIVPRTNRGGGRSLWRKLWWRKKANSRKKPIPLLLHD